MTCSASFPLCGSGASAHQMSATKDLIIHGPPLGWGWYWAAITHNISKFQNHGCIPRLMESNMLLFPRHTVQLYLCFKCAFQFGVVAPLQDLPVFTDPVDLPQWLCLLATVTGSWHGSRFQDATLVDMIASFKWPMQNKPMIKICL